MAHYRGTRIIDAPIEAVFDYRLDVRNLPDYNPEARNVEVVRRGSPVEGQTYSFRLRIAPGLWSRVTLTVANVERPSHLEFRIRALMNAREVCSFERVETERGAGTRIRFDYEVDTRGGPLAPFIDAIFVKPSMRRLVERELDLIKRRLAGDRPPTR